MLQPGIMKRFKKNTFQAKLGPLRDGSFGLVENQTSILITLIAACN